MTDTTTTTTTGTGTTGTTTTTTQPSWFAGFDDETKGYLTNRGWDKKSPAEAFLEAAKSHREAEKRLGAPANELLRIPKPDDEAGTKAFWNRLGAPTDPKDYDFSGVKFSDGTEVDQAFTDYMRQRAAELHLPKDTATRMATAFVKFLDDADKAETTENAARIADEKVQLNKNWGVNAPANMIVAQNAIKALLGASGISADKIQEAINGLESQVGYATTMELFRQIGSKIGEDKFVRSLAPGNTGVMTRDEALATKAEKMRDKDWVRRYLDGGSAERREMTSLDKIITGAAA